MRTLPLIVLSLALLVPAGVPQARAAALTHKPRPAAAQAAPAGGSKAMAAKPAPRRGAAAAPAAGSDAPFWTGHPSAASFEKSNDQRLARVRQLVARLTAVPGKRTLENTLRPYDDILLELDAVGSQAGLMENVHPDSAVRSTAERLTQKAAALGTELSLNRKVYDALTALDLGGADEETRYYVQRELRDFRLAGVDKDEQTREKIKALRDELVKTGQEFDRNIRSDESSVVVDNAVDLEGLPEDFIARHKPDASGKIVLSTEYPDLFPVMTYAKKEDLRKRMYIAYSNKAYPQNMAVLDSLIAKRHRLANLLGFPNWASYFTADKMVGSSDKASEFIDQIVQASAERARTDWEVLLARKRKDVPGATGLDIWDRFYWPELIRKEQYNFDAQQMRPYLPYDRVKQGVLDVTSRMFGVTYQQVKDAPAWHPAVECYEMYEGAKRVGRFYLDMHPRPDKFSHAAQFDIRTGVEGRQIPEAALICNLPGGDPGDPGLCEMNDVVTFFHEFGHLLHNQFAGHHRWVGIGGIRTEHDFVEAPSQMLEEWMHDPAVLQIFARHYQTGQPIPAELVQQMRRAQDFGELDPKGLDVRRQMVLAGLSLAIYDRDPSQVNTDSLIRELNEKYFPYPYVPGTHFQCAFGHLDGYSAGYYTYMWSKVIAKDLFSQFDKSNLLDPTVARRYRDAVLAPGGSVPAAKLVENFLGRPFSFAAYQAWLNQRAN